MRQLFARVHSTQIAFFHLRRRRIYQASDIAKLWLEFLSARVRSTLHQTIGRAKLRQDFLPVLDLRAYARLCGEIKRASKVLSNKRTLVAFAYAPLEQFMKDKEKPLREPAQRTLRT